MNSEPYVYDKLGALHCGIGYKEHCMGTCSAHCTLGYDYEDDVR